MAGPQRGGALAAVPQLTPAQRGGAGDRGPAEGTPPGDNQGPRCAHLGLYPTVTLQYNIYSAASCQASYHIQPLLF